MIGLAVPSEEASFRSIDRNRAGWDLEKSPPALVAGMAKGAGRRHMNSAGPGHDARGGQPGDPGQSSAMPAIERDAAGSRPSRFRRVFSGRGTLLPAQPPHQAITTVWLWCQWAKAPHSKVLRPPKVLPVPAGGPVLSRDATNPRCNRLDAAIIDASPARLPPSPSRKISFRILIEKDRRRSMSRTTMKPPSRGSAPPPRCVYPGTPGGIGCSTAGAAIGWTQGQDGLVRTPGQAGRRDSLRNCKTDSNFQAFPIR